MRKKFQLFPTILFILVASSLTLSCSSTKEMAAIDKEHTQSVSPSTLIIYYDAEIGKEPLEFLEYCFSEDIGTLLISELSRLGRNVDEVLKNVMLCKERRLNVHFQKENLSILAV